MRKTSRELSNLHWGMNESHPNEFIYGEVVYQDIGTPVPLLLDGTVINICEHPKRDHDGLYIWVYSPQHDVTMMYAHLDEVLVDVGSKVKQGDIIAYSGVSGVVFEPQVLYRMNHGQSTSRIVSTLKDPSVIPPFIEPEWIQDYGEFISTSISGLHERTYPSEYSPTVKVHPQGVKLKYIATCGDWYLLENGNVI